MRIKPLSLAITSMLLMGQATTAQAVNLTPSQIKQVTIYQGKAAVERELPVTGGGEQQVVFGCLSGNVDQNSIQINAPSPVNVGEINVQTLSGEQAKLCQRQGNQAIGQTQDSLDSINAKIIAQEATLAYLQNFGKTQQLNNTGNIKTSASELAQSAEQAAVTLAALRQQKAQLETQLASDMNASTTVANRVTQVSVRLASRSPSTVTLHYLVNGASWQPQYQANLDTERNQLDIKLQAVVAQTTGENWQNVPLTLSTAEPSYYTALNTPSANVLRLYDPKANSRAMMAEPAPVVMPVVMDSGEDESSVPLPSYQANSTAKGDLTEYRLPQRVTIPSDGRRITTLLDSQTTAAEVWARSVPMDNLKAFWYAKAPSFNKNWVDGDIRLYRDNNYIGNGQFNVEQIRNNGFGFGVNHQILVTALADDNQSDKAGLFGGTKTETMTSRYRFTNQMNRPIKMEVVSGIPVSQDGQISVKSSYDPLPTTLTWQDKKGVVAWLFNLAPSQSQVIGKSHEISYPKDKELY